MPTLYIALLNQPDVKSGKVDFKSIRLCVSGASALLADTKQRFEAITGGRIVEGYSLTEAMMALCVNPVKGENKLGSVGMPLPDVHVRIVDARRGYRTLPANEVGEIIIAAPQLMIRVLEPSRRNGGDCFASTATNRRRGGGCTRATSVISTRTATCSSSIARRI